MWREGSSGRARPKALERRGLAGASRFRIQAVRELPAGPVIRQKPARDGLGVVLERAGLGMTLGWCSVSRKWGHQAPLPPQWAE